MWTFSRRGLLLGGGTLGAISASGIVAPRAWSWSPAGSVLGSGVGLDPRTVWDTVADPIVARLYENGQVDLVNDLLSTWTTNSQPLPAGLPAELRDFLEDARRLPAWTDPATLSRAFKFYEKRGLYLGALYGFGSGMMSTVIPREAKAVYYSAGGADMKDRIAKTAKLGYDIGHRDAFGPTGQMVVTCLKTRLTHAAVRHLLPQSGHWRGNAETGELFPISQADMMVTWHSLATFTHNKLDVWGVPVPSADRTAFLHLWQMTAHMLGIEDEYIPATWTQANDQATQVLDPVLGPTPEGIELAQTLLGLIEYDQGLSKPLLHAFTRYNLGDQICEWLNIPEEPVWDNALKYGWPPFIRFRESTMHFPGAPQMHWTFDELLRLLVLFFLNDGQRINITMPSGNNPHYA